MITRTNILIYLYYTSLLQVPLTESATRPRCGQIMTKPNSAKLQPKIVKGYEVGYYKYPWYAALQIDDDTFCGGAIIGHNIVLTAAHCFDAAKGSNLEDYYKVKLGVSKQCEKEPTQTKYNVQKVWIHEKYKDLKPYYDIALMKLQGDTSPYLPICLPTKIYNDKDQELEAWIAGFGSTIEGNEDSYPCEMREGRILMYDNATCKAMVLKQDENERYNRYIKAICAGYESGLTDTCQGDSGGPLMTLNSLTNLWQTVGVVSYGWGCGEKGALGVYTDVSRYLDWIEEKTGITPSDQQSNNENSIDDDNQEEQNQMPSVSTSDDVANTFIKIYEHIMNSPNRPVEITIKFENQTINKTVRKQKQKKHPHARSRKNNTPNMNKQKT